MHIYLMEMLMQLQVRLYTDTYQYTVLSISSILYIVMYIISECVVCECVMYEYVQECVTCACVCAVCGCVLCVCMCVCMRVCMRVCMYKYNNFIVYTFSD